MLRRQIVLTIFVLGFGLAMAACTVQVTPTTPTPEPATPAPPPAAAPEGDEVVLIRLHLLEMQQDMARLHEVAPQLDEQAQANMHELMADFMNETAGFMMMLDRAMQGMTPEERQLAMEFMRQMQDDMQQMDQAMPGPDSPPNGTPDMGQMSRHMDQMHEQMRDSSQEMGPEHRQRMMIAMSDMMGNMDLMVVHMEGAIRGMSEQDRMAMLQQVVGMHDILKEMLQVAGLEPTVLPLPESSAIVEEEAGQL